MEIRKPNRIKHKYSQILHAPAKSVFPLLCPVLEAKWVPGWNPKFVISNSGVAELDCIFSTHSDPFDSIWIITRYQPESFSIEMIKITPNHTIGKLIINLSEIEENNTKADISYEYTSLSASGDVFLKEFTDEWYKEFMINWEKALNHYLDTGKKLEE